LNLKCDFLVSNFAFKLNLCRYIAGHKVHDWAMEAGAWRLLFAAGKISLCAT
jgi:hypothetical protein